MKITDYGPRVAPMDAYLTGRNLVGAEVGVDVGAHAEALLRYCDIRHLLLIDEWPRELQCGWCEGRLRALGFWPRVTMRQRNAHQASVEVHTESLDFVYIDIRHDSDTAREALEDWWPKVKPGGVLAYRQYHAPSVAEAVDAFTARHGIRIQVEEAEILLWR